MIICAKLTFLETSYLSVFGLCRPIIYIPHQGFMEPLLMSTVFTYRDASIKQFQIIPVIIFNNLYYQLIWSTFVKTKSIGLKRQWLSRKNTIRLKNDVFKWRHMSLMIYLMCTTTSTMINFICPTLGIVCKYFFQNIPPIIFKIFNYNQFVFKIKFGLKTAIK